MKRVLLVDPRASSRRALAIQLVQRGFDVATASDVACALRLAEVARPTLALVNQELPDALGLVLALDRLPGGAIPVVIVRSTDLDGVFDASGEPVAVAS